MPAYVSTGLNFVHVRDVALGHVLAARHGRPGERYILGGANLTMREFLSCLASLTGRKDPWLRLPYAAAWCLGWASTTLSERVTRKGPAIPLEAVRMAKRHMYFDSSKAVRELRLPRTPVREAAREAIEWFSNNGFFSTSLKRGSQLWQSP
jgi:dihydroflavonol-4-reductase